MKVIGSIDNVAIDSVSGWLAAPGAAEPRFVRVFVDNVEQGTIRADIFRSDLKEKKISNGFSGYKFTFSKPLDPLFDHVIRIEDSSDGKFVGKTEMPLKGELSAKNGEGERFFGLDRDFVTVNIGPIGYVKDGIDITVVVNGLEDILAKPKVSNADFQLVGIENAGNAYLNALKIPAKNIRLKLRPTDPSQPVQLVVLDEERIDKRFRPVIELLIPGSLPKYLSTISKENMARVTGPNSAVGIFAAGGLNTAYRIEQIVKQHFGKGISEMGRCLDWGVGAGRVAVPVARIVAPKVKVFGVDVDPYNIAFGRETYPDISFSNSPLLPPLAFEDRSFDAIYGISVFTHLTESVQFAWLKELRRLVNQGSPVIMTIHSEMALFNTAQRRADTFLEASKWGISDNMLDGNLGPKLSERTYYRSTFHTRKYILGRWNEWFDVVAIYTGANVGAQDFVVLRAK